MAVFLREAELIHPHLRFEIDSEHESEGGEQAILDRRTMLAGTARRPTSNVLREGIVATEIGRDAIAVIVHRDNPVPDLSMDQLAGIFSGETSNWKDVGGPDLAIQPHVVGRESATREVFREKVLEGKDDSRCKVVRPDQEIIHEVAQSPGAIGHISFSFLQDVNLVRPLSVNGQAPAVTNFDYPICRPLYLLWREEAPRMEEFVSWCLSDEGQQVVMRHFVGSRVVASVRSVSKSRNTTGALIVYTETFPFNDGGIYYYPHLPYEIFDRRGQALVRRVRNHRGRNDEKPMRILLAPDLYLVRTRMSSGESPQFFVTIEPGKTTELRVLDQLQGVE